jgi:hypothetical protein
MAKSKSGGTRAMIRGRVGSDVYSIGRDAQGKRQQVVRSLAETVANPQTVAQMRGRMIMSTIMQAQSALLPIIDHSFDNVSGRQANLSEFIARNYQNIKADIAAHPSTGNIFGLNMYQEKGAKQGAYIISDGKASLPAAVSFVQGTAVLTITVAGTGITLAALREAWEIGANGYLTIVGINTNGGADYARLHLDFAADAETVVSSANVASLFTISGNATPVIAVSGQNITFTLASIAGCSSVICTRKNNAGFYHSKAVLGAAAGINYAANIALDSYPLGEAKFLNGGSADATASSNNAISGGDSSNSGGSNNNDNGSGDNGGGSSSGTGVALTIVKTGTGTASVKDASNNEITSGQNVAAGSTVTVSVVPAENQTPVATLNGEAVNLTADNGSYVGTFTMPSSAATLSINSGSVSGGGADQN